MVGPERSASAVGSAGRRRAEDAVQKLTVSATHGDVATARTGERCHEFNEGLAPEFSELLYAVVPYNATAAQMQEASKDYTSRVR